MYARTRARGDSPHLSGALRAFGTTPGCGEMRLDRCSVKVDPQVVERKRKRRTGNKEDGKQWSTVCQEVAAACMKQNATKVN